MAKFLVIHVTIMWFGGRKGVFSLEANIEKRDKGDLGHGPCDVR